MSLKEGRYPTSDNEVVVEKGNSILRSYKVGETITIPFLSLA